MYVIGGDTALDRWGHSTCTTVRPGTRLLFGALADTTLTQQSRTDTLDAGLADYVTAQRGCLGRTIPQQASFNRVTSPVHRHETKVKAAFQIRQKVLDI